MFPKGQLTAPYVGTSRPIATDQHAQVAQSVEHVLGKDEVGGSIPLLGFAQFATFWMKVIIGFGAMSDWQIN